MHAFLITGGTPEARLRVVEDKLKGWEIHPLDQVNLAPRGLSIGISEVREFIKRLHLTPYRSKAAVGIVKDGELLTLEAQQALLKTLEEPPGGTSIILETESRATLLPTVVSRCQIIDLGSSPTPPGAMSSLALLQKVAQMKPGARLPLAETIATTREEAVAWAELVLAAARELMLSYYQLSTLPTPRNLRDSFSVNRALSLIRLLLVARRELLANVQPRLVIDNVFLAL